MTHSFFNVSEIILPETPETPDIPDSLENPEITLYLKDYTLNFTLYI